MMVDRTHERENDAQRERLRALVARLGDADLGRPLDAGWTVAAVLAHLAFWDERARLLLERWQRDGTPPPPLDERQVHWINDAAKPLCLALPPRVAAQLALERAEAVDRLIAGLPDAFLAASAAAGHPVRLLRATHRREHLDEIERTLGR